MVTVLVSWLYYCIISQCLIDYEVDSTYCSNHVFSKLHILSWLKYDVYLLQSATAITHSLPYYFKQKRIIPTPSNSYYSTNFTYLNSVIGYVLHFSPALSLLFIEQNLVNVFTSYFNFSVILCSHEINFINERVKCLGVNST